MTDRATEQTAYLGDVTCVPCLGTLSLATRQRWVALFNAKYPDGIE